MRATNPARFAAALFLGVAAAAPFELAECLSTNAATLASFASCGHAGSIEYCLANRLPADSQLCTADVLAQCFINAGCQPDEALIEAAWTIKRCERGVELSELRRRSPADDSSAATEKTTKKTTEKTTAATTTGTTETTASAASTAAATSTASKTLVSKDAASTFTGTTTSSLVCETTTTIMTKTCPTQSTGTASGKEMACFTTEQSYATCAAGLMCVVDNKGVTNCMKKQGADAAGITIAIVFGSGLLIAIATLCFFCCRERRQDARHAKAAEASAIARQAVIDSKKAKAATAPTIAVNTDSQPLMTQGYEQQAYAPQYHNPVSNTDLRAAEPSGDIAGPNPFADNHDLR